MIGETPIGNPDVIPSRVRDGFPGKSGSLEWYGYHWDRMVQDQDSWTLGELKRTVRVIEENKARYQTVSLLTSVPWQMIAAIHYRESSLSWGKCLHNGDPLGKKTTRVPAGRGPFYTWEEAAVDALRFDGLAGRDNWTIEKMLQMLEKYNGTGYLKYHPETMSPYVWAGTNLSTEKGKYKADGKFDPNAPEKQLGVAVILKALGIA